MKLSDLLKWSYTSLKNAGIEDYAYESNFIFEEITGFKRNKLLLEPNYNIENSLVAEVIFIVNKRRLGYPLSYILGYSYFWHYRFVVNSSCLIPRKDSEFLVEKSLELLSASSSDKLRVLDLGCGSGCLLLSILRDMKNSDIKGVGVDIDSSALKVSIANSKSLGLKDKSLFIKSDWFSQLDKNKKFDLIVSNPPYINRNDREIANDVRKYEPSIALFVDNNGLLSYEKIFSQVKGYLKQDGKIIVEIGYNQFEAVKSIAQRYNLLLLHKIKDYNKLTRCLVFGL